MFRQQPFDGGKFDRRYTDVFEPAIKAANLEPYRVDRDPRVEIPIEEIERGIANADVCLAEITTDNPNVWFELGYAIASGKPVCLICSSERTTAFPFDVRHRTILTYDTGSPSDFQKLESAITDRLTALLQRQRSIETIASLKPTTSAEGLTPHEIAILALLLAGFDVTGVTGHQLKQDMRKAGYTEIAAGLAIEKLRRRGFVTDAKEEDFDGNSYAVWTLTASATDWLIAHEDQLNLHVETGTKRKAGAESSDHFTEIDIPF